MVLVRKQENESGIGAMFSQIARRYDLVNHLTSVGLDLYWRKRAAEYVKPLRNHSVIDVCCGTGAFAFAFAKSDHAPAAIVGVDISEKMLAQAKRKQVDLTAKSKLGSTDIKWVCGDCTKLCFDSKLFDIASCAFGLRNIPDFRAALKEMHRVLKSTGRVCILEFSLPKQWLLRRIYLLYFRHVMPWVGGLLSGEPGAYRHLSDSVCRWDSDIDLAAELKSAGFREINVLSLTFGIAKIYFASKT